MVPKTQPLAASRVEANKVVRLFVGILLAALAYWLCVVLGLPTVVGIIAAILVLIACVPAAGYGLRRG